MTEQIYTQWNESKSIDKILNLKFNLLNHLKKKNDSLVTSLENQEQKIIYLEYKKELHLLSTQLQTLLLEKIIVLKNIIAQLEVDKIKHNDIMTKLENKR